MRISDWSSDVCSSDLEGFAEFFGVDPDLMQAAAELAEGDATTSKDDLRETLAAIPDREKIDLLLRVADGDNYVVTELRSRLRRRRPAPTLPPRTAGALRARAREIAEARERADADSREAEGRRQAKQAEKERRARLRTLKQRGAAVWREIEDEIERRNAAGYDRSTSLLCDLPVFATIGRA